MSKNNAVVFLTQNTKLCNQLQSALKKAGFIVIRVENIEGVNNAVKHNAVGAVVLHVKDANGWIIFELMRTGFQNIPRFAILAPSLTGEEADMIKLAQKYDAEAIIGERGDMHSLATMILGVSEADDDANSKEAYLKLYGDISRELIRLQEEFTQTSLRTLPQPEIGADTQTRLRTALAGLKRIKLLP